MIRILVTGSRTWPDDGSVDYALCDVIKNNPTESTFVIVHGDCNRGADAQAKRAISRLQMLASRGHRVIYEETHPADWDAYGVSAGLKRNLEMISTGADICLAFLGPCEKHPSAGHNSHGASYTATEAERAGIKTVRYVQRGTRGV